jgi:hypothetical protein
LAIEEKRKGNQKQKEQLYKEEEGGGGDINERQSELQGQREREQDGKSAIYLSTYHLPNSI